MVNKSDLKLKLGGSGLTNCCDHNIYDAAVEVMIESLADELCKLGRIEVRGFGSIWVSKIYEHQCRLPGGNVFYKKIPRIRFKPGKSLKGRVNK